MIERCLFLIKPNAIAYRDVGHIISMIEEHGFEIRDTKLFRFDPSLSRHFYAEHADKEFYPRLESFMCSGDTIALLLEKENAIHDIRQLLGDVVPEKRKPGTIRALYGQGITDNGGHASDSTEHAAREIEIIFGY
jgi:nucleoside-diphosphate kinase